MKGPGELLLDDIPDPFCPPGGALVKVEACAVCGTDVKMLEHGHRDLRYPRVLGHEIVGRIIELETEEGGLAIGDRVQVWPGISCGKCRPCSRGNDNQCESQGILGFNVDGGYAEYVALPSGNVQHGGLNRVEERDDPVQLALSEPLACCLNGQALTRVSEGDRVLVLGGGPVGAIHVALAKQKGAEKVIVSERMPNRIALLRDRADRVIDHSTEDLAKTVMDETEGKGIDVILPATPEVRVDEYLMSLLASNGRLCVFSGPRKGEYEAPIDVRSMHYKEQTMVGAYGCSSSHDREAVMLIRSGEVDLSWIVTHRCNLKEVHGAIDHTAMRRGMKSVIVF
ncbi:MAG TPA: alcohol dehydrogenase catalytic domain-containing protein [Methanomassiliicoccales archaeon]